MTTTTHITEGGARRRTARRTSCALLVAALAAAVSTTSFQTLTTEAAATTTTPAPYDYTWPVKPFGKAHPVRANFGDPRTTFQAPATPAGLMRGDGTFAFHFGVDIYAPDATPVYPVRDGEVTVAHGLKAIVAHADGTLTEYWHIHPAVTVGQRVQAHRTVLGTVIKGFEHVHFSERVRGAYVNPLAPGHLGPYRDRTEPVVHSISFRRGAQDVLAESVSGRVNLLVEAYDTPALRVPGRWNGLPVSPARVTWTLVGATNRRTMLRRREAVDFRRAIPSNDSFWRYYARGTRQNMAEFAGQRAWRASGVYLYSLTRDPFDTAKLRNGIYRLVVTAEDIAGNRSSATKTFIVRNTGA